MTPGGMHPDALDAADPLRDRRALFDGLDGRVYLDGNSLGPPTRAALARIRQTAEDDWRDRLVGAWNETSLGPGWIDLPARAGEKIARIIGARPGEAIVADTVTANLFKLAGALLGETGGRPRALAVEGSEFPTDAHVLEGLARVAGAPFRLIPVDGDPFADGPCVFVKSLVDYRTAAVADLEAVEARAAATGSAVIWDLSHAAGVLDLRLAGRPARYAVGCGYKYLGGGPGAPAFVFVRRDEQETLRPPLQGWMGAADPFGFSTCYAPGAGLKRFLAGTPPVLSLAALDAGLDAFAGVSMADAEAKARALGDLFLARVAPLGLASASPPSARRGGHVSLRHEAGYAVMQALIARGVVGDFRPPDLMRFGFSPLALRYADAAAAADALADILHTEDWRRPEYAARRTVT